MKLYVIRHGDDGEEDVDGKNDRPLTDNGRATIEKLAGWMAKNYEVPNIVYAGPRVRTIETANILREELGLPKIRIEDGLAPERGNALGAVVKKIISDKSLKRVAIVSDHGPIEKGLSALNMLDKGELDRMAMGEVRILKIDRKDALWDEMSRMLPSDIDESAEDIY